MWYEVYASLRREEGEDVLHIAFCEHVGWNVFDQAMRQRTDKVGGARFGVGNRFVCRVAGDTVADLADRPTPVSSQQMGLESTFCHWSRNPIIFSWFNFARSMVEGWR